jgi:hypothetical protein
MTNYKFRKNDDLSKAARASKEAWQKIMSGVFERRKKIRKRITNPVDK